MQGICFHPKSYISEHSTALLKFTLAWRARGSAVVERSSIKLEAQGSNSRLNWFFNLNKAAELYLPFVRIKERFHRTPPPRNIIAHNYPEQGLIDKVEGDTNSMANRVMRHLQGYSFNLYTGFGDQLKTLNILEIWSDFYN